MKKICIIGLGRFGQHLCKILSEQDYTVLAIDTDEASVSAVRDIAQKAVIADARDFEVLSGLISKDFDRVIMSLAKNIEASVLCTLNLDKLGITKITAKVSSEEHKEILERLGVEKIIFPESESAEQLAKQLINPNLLEYVPLSDGYNIVEIDCPEDFIGKNLVESDARNKFGIFVIAIKQSFGKEVDIMPRPDRIFKKGEKLIVIGSSDSLEKLTKNKN